VVIMPFGSLDQAFGDFRTYNAHAFRTTPDQSVLAAAAGKVISVATDPVEGLTLVVDHGGGMSTRYSGLARVLVAQGTQVQPGAVIAQSGGATPVRAEMGPHLTFAVWLDGQPIDPTPLLGE
jgi:murein DD-endopeptidase MepM/ murein hydrolase activator NlpD